jgi:hypothetical protein
METPAYIRLQRQAEDAAKRLHRTTGKGCLAAVINEMEGGDTGLAFSIEGLRTGQVETALTILLGQLAMQLEPGVVEGCSDCKGSHDRVLAALKALTGATDEDDAESCPICMDAFKGDDLCATDIELGTCHAACLEGSPVVDLDTGEPTDGEPFTYRFDSLPQPKASAGQEQSQ